MEQDVLVCPECGLPLTHVDVKAHANEHYSLDLDPAKMSKLAVANRDAILSGGVTVSAYQEIKSGGA